MKLILDESELCKIVSNHLGFNIINVSSVLDTDEKPIDLGNDYFDGLSFNIENKKTEIAQ